MESAMSYRSSMSAHSRAVGRLGYDKPTIVSSETSTCVKGYAYDMLGPTCLLFSLTNEYADCIPLSAHTSEGTLGERCAAARITRAITSVAERETPHWQLQHPRNY